jgi:hypothetical protein
MTLKVAGVMTAVALLAKFIPAFITQKIYGYSKDERSLIFGLSSAQAAATLAAVLVGYNIITDYQIVNSIEESGIRNGKLILENKQEITFENIKKGQPININTKATLNGVPADGIYELSSKNRLFFSQGTLTEIKTPTRLLNENVLNGTILMILITCTIASFVAQNGAYKLALAEDEGNKDDENAEESDEKILIPLKNTVTVDELVNLSITIKSKNNRSGLYGLNVIDNSEGAEMTEIKSKKILDRAKVVASATDSTFNTLLRYDLNVLNGITSIVKENKITDIIIGLTDKTNPGDNLFGNLTKGILNKCQTTTFIYKSIQPIATVKRYIVVIPEKAEREIGFPFWLVKIWNLSKNTGAKLVFYASTQTNNFLKDIQSKHPTEVEFNEFEDWNDFLILSRNIQKDDGLVVVMSRKSHLSYHNTMANIPVYMTKYFNQNNVLLIFPLQSGMEQSTKIDLMNPAALETFTENLERLDEVRKMIGKLFLNSTNKCNFWKRWDKIFFQKREEKKSLPLC